MRTKLELLRVGGALLTGASALLAGMGHAAAELDGAGLFVLPPDPVLIREALCAEASEPRAAAARSRGVMGQLRSLGPQAERLQELGVMPLFLGFHGFGLKVRGTM